MKVTRARRATGVLVLAVLLVATLSTGATARPAHEIKLRVEELKTWRAPSTNCGW